MHCSVVDEEMRMMLCSALAGSHELEEDRRGSTISRALIQIKRAVVGDHLDIHSYTARYCCME